MLTYDKLVARYGLLSEFHSKYRKELTAYGEEYWGATGIYEAGAYEKFLNQLSDEEYRGTTLAYISNDYAVLIAKTVLSGKLSIEDYIKAEKKALRI